MGVLLSAQGQGADEGQVYDEMIQEQVTTMELTEEQEVIFVEISNRYLEEFKEVKANSASKLAKLKEVKSLNAEKDKELTGLLTKEQFKTYKELQKKNRSKLKAARNE
jgi:hypothetical protein